MVDLVHVLKIFKNPNSYVKMMKMIKIMKRMKIMKMILPNFIWKSKRFFMMKLSDIYGYFWILVPYSFGMCNQISAYFAPLNAGKCTD